MVTSFFRCIYVLLFLSFQVSGRSQDFDIVTHKTKVTIVYSKEAPAIDSIAANLLAQDIERVTTYRPLVTVNLANAKGAVIVIGSIQSTLIQQFADKQSPFYKGLINKWECFGLKVIEKPTAVISKALLVAGSDARGTAYGVFSLSEKIGVSPWWWWADVPVKQQRELVLHQQEFTSVPPSVKYRGIFINDEDWGLRPWAATTFEAESKALGPKTYAKVFELSLRLKANLLWPAMHPGTEPFYNNPANKKMAADFSIIIGSSHAEPMLRNNVGEWDEKRMGDFNYITNKESVYRYWEERVKQSKGNDVVYTMGMRGVHDSGIEGVKDAKEAVPLLERIIKDQRELLVNYLHKDIASIPQAFTAYKEVLDIYDSGLRLPEDVTLVWPDDNYGYIQRLNDSEEASRSGGSGVYYHASYWGRPHDYLWLSTTHPSLIREEMMKAAESGANRLWVLNVGDIKPLEYNMQLFLDMAYNATPFNESSYTRKHLSNWCGKIFGFDKGKPIANILWGYYDLAFERRPEFMGWSQTEPTTKTTYTNYNHFYFGDEAQLRIDRYDSLEKEAVKLRRQIDRSGADAFYQLVYYPVVCAALMNKKFLYRDKAWLYGKQSRLSALNFAERSQAAYDSIVKETGYYNDSLKRGKWKNMMSMKPRDLPVYDAPVLPAIRLQKSEAWSVAPEGYDTTALVKDAEKQLPIFYSGCMQRFFIDVFLSDSLALNWTANGSNDWLILSARKGLLSPEDNKNETRLWATIDWSKAPRKESFGGKIIFAGSDGREHVVNVRGINLKESKNFDGKERFVEINGFVSIYAQHFSKALNKASGSWNKIEGLGHTGASLMARLEPVKPLIKLADTVAIFKQQAANVAYDFYSLSEVPPRLSVYTLPTHPLNKNYSMRYGFSIDDGPVQIMDFKTVGRSEEWKQNVLQNSAIKTTDLPALKSGRHTLKIYAVDPGVILDRILITFGDLKKAYGVIPETRYFGDGR